MYKVKKIAGAEAKVSKNVSEHLTLEVAFCGKIAHRMPQGYSHM